MSADDLQLGKIWYQPPPGSLRWAHPSRWTEGDWWHWCRQGPSPMTAAQFAQYWSDRFAWGIGVRATDRRGKASGPIRWLYNPIPKAVAFHASSEQYLLYGGARGGAKSHSLRFEAHARCLQYPGYRAILFRRMHEELKQYHVDRSRQEVKEMTNGVGRVIGDDICDYGNGSVLAFGHAKDVGSESKYLGAEFDLVLFDQMETFAPSQIIDIMGAGRSSKEGVQSLVRGTANPGGVSPQWIIDRFLTKDPPAEDRLTYDPADWRYIAARVYDNPYLMDADGTFGRQESRLSQYGPVRRRQMLLGDWTAREGQFFPELVDHKHITTREVAAGTRWYAGLDYGYSRPGGIVLVAAMPDGHLYCRYELPFQGRPLYAAPRAHAESKADYAARAANSVAFQLEQLCQTHGIKIHQLLCDPDLDAQKTGGETGIEGLRRVGLPAVPASNNRFLGWLRLRHWFQDAPDGTPWLQFHPDCKTTWRSLTGLVNDKTNPEDVDTDGFDHLSDSLRYLVMSRPSPDLRQAGQTKYAAGSIGDMIRKSQGRRGAARIV